MSRDRPREIERVDRILAGIIILEFDADAAIRYAVIKAAMLRRGRPIGDCDTLIAAAALASGQLLVTRNKKHFASIPGLAVDWY